VKSNDKRLALIVWEALEMSQFETLEKSILLYHTISAPSCFWMDAFPGFVLLKEKWAFNKTWLPIQ